MKNKKLYKSRKNKKICGVCGGVGKYLELDPTIVRVVWAILVFCCGIGLLAYFIAALILPFDSEENS